MARYNCQLMVFKQHQVLFKTGASRQDAWLSLPTVLITS